jgi:hypothetical protein
MWKGDSLKLIVSSYRRCAFAPSPALRGRGWGGGAIRGLPMRFSSTPTLPRKRERESSIARVDIIGTLEALE